MNTESLYEQSAFENTDGGKFQVQPSGGDVWLLKTLPCRSDSNIQFKILAIAYLKPDFIIKVSH